MKRFTPHPEESRLVEKSMPGPETGTGPRARAGDQIIVEGRSVGAVRRDGEVIGVHHDDGSPPYDVRWSDTGRVTLFFPGPDAHIRHLGRHAGG